MSSDVPTGGAAAPLVRRGEDPPAGLLVRSRYRIIGELGAGAFGTVSLAEDESTGHRVAIRFFPRRLSQAPEAVRTVLRTGRSTVGASSAHPALTRVLEFGEIDNQPFAIMERVEGRRLSELMSKGKQLDVATAMRLALDLGGDLETLHNMGFVHGAVCPHNIMVLDDGRLKLLDIELAGLRDARELQGVIAATPPAEYLAPEQISRAPVDEKADTYAFGAVLYELLCGVPPFQGATREGVLAKHLAPIHPRRRDAPHSVERAVMLALGKRPESRPLLGDLLNILWAGVHGPASGRRRVTGIVAAAVLAAVSAGAVTWGALALWAPAPFAPTARPTPEPLPPLSAPPAPPVRVPEARPRFVTTPAPPAPSPKPVERAPAVAPVPSPASRPAPPRVDRLEPTRTPPATAASPARPAAAPDSDDPGAVIDWLLNLSSRP